MNTNSINATHSLMHLENIYIEKSFNITPIYIERNETFINNLTIKDSLCFIDN